MKVAGDYEFGAPVGEVWKALLDPVVLASVMPGCEKLDLVDDAYLGELNVKVGPVQGKFQGKVTLSEVEEEKGYSVAVDGRGAPGFVKAKMNVQLTPLGSERTRMSYEGDAQVGGRIASVGQRLIDASAKAIIAESLEGLNKNVTARAAAAPGAPIPVVEGPSQSEFAAKVAKEVAKDLVPPPVRWGLLLLALAAVAAVIYFLVSR